ncbi:MAG: TonB-dependent receptor, partial [Bacteroidales bacterium]|nr:TonB-dependent receptor [Bacteroidales bacterium]
MADDIRRHYYLSEVVISAPSKEIIQPQKLEGAVLERLNSLSVADAIRFFSGIQIKDYGGVGGIKTVNIRSMG